MKDKMQEEKEVLSVKRKLIEDELEEKQKNLDNVESKVRALSKEAKGSYSEEKETTEKIYNVLAKDINSFKEALEEPYFGRIDFREHKRLDESIYIGKKGIINTKEGEEVVVDAREEIREQQFRAETYHAA